MPHSPGDWEIRDNEIWVKVDDSRKAIKIAIVVPWPKVTDDNVRLIAAAPGLLAALERLLEETNQFMNDSDACECGEYGNGLDDEGNVCEHIQARRAIAKAKGQ